MLCWFTTVGANRNKQHICGRQLAMSTISIRSETKLRTWHFFNIQAKQTWLIPKILKIEAKRALLIQEVTKIEAKRPLPIPDIRKIEAKQTLLIPDNRKIKANQTLPFQ
jgi:hypothetical protein